MFTGAERYANEFDLPVIYAMIQKVKRGHYTLEYKLVTEHPRELPEVKLTEMCANINEEMIRRQPEYWLWTHRRWKHTRENVKFSND
jgi:KDO2-lipid IV(A) lauroyltransferase